MRLKDCHNFADFRKLAEKKLPSPSWYSPGVKLGVKFKAPNLYCA